MRTIQGTRSLGTPFVASVLTIGNFDGVHLGHQALIRRLVARAREKSRPAVLITFDPHPVQVLYPERQLRRIFPREDLASRVSELGVDALVVEPFSREFAQLSPERYLSDWLLAPFHPETVVVGYDFNFGANREGSIEVLQAWGERQSIRVEVTPPVKVGDIVVSSSRIRQSIEAGDVELAALLLGRCFYVSGVVGRGAGRGRQISIPTANLVSPPELIPARGVYAAWAEVRGERYGAAVNVGFNPTFIAQSGPVPSIEAHLLDFPRSGAAGDLYGEPLRLSFVSRIREEKKFSSIDALVAQIRSDIDETAIRLKKADPQ